jgi:hypothetical protein
MPKSNMGKWSMWLIIAMLILIFIGMSTTTSLYSSVESGDTIAADILKRPALALSMLAGFGAGVSAFVTGLFAIFKAQDRRVIVFVSTIMGALLTLFLIAEIAFPH